MSGAVPLFPPCMPSWHVMMTTVPFPSQVVQIQFKKDHWVVSRYQTNATTQSDSLLSEDFPPARSNVNMELYY